MFGNGVDELDLRCVVSARTLSFLRDDLFLDALNMCMELEENEQIAEYLILTGSENLGPDKPLFIADMKEIAELSWVGNMTLNEHLASILPMFVANPVMKNADPYGALSDVVYGEDFEVYCLGEQILVVVKYLHKPDEIFELDSIPESLYPGLSMRLKQLT